MEQNSMEMVFIIDKSGSMSGLESDTIGGFNSTIEKHRNDDGDVIVSTVLFSTEFSTIHDRIPIASVEPMTEKDYFASGCTALLDALGNSIKHIEDVHAHMQEADVPKKKLFVAITDGLENSSREFTYSKLKKLIDKKTEDGWEFIYLGANIDAVAEASKIGIGSDNAVNYHCDEAGLEKAYRAVDRKVECCMSCTMDRSWREEIDADFKKRAKKRSD